MGRLYVGARDESVVLHLVPEGDDVDFTFVVTGECTIEVQQPDGSSGSWPATVSNVTTTTITLTHVLAADGSDVPKAGPLKFYGKMPVVGGGFIRSQAFVVPAFEEFDTTY